MYDLAVIGGGPAGYSAALEAARLGLDVILFEKEELGGTCLNRGCVPMAFLSHVSQLMEALRRGQENGLLFNGERLDYVKTNQRKKELISNLKNGLLQQIRKKRVEIIQGKALIASANRISCNGEAFETNYILVATGSIPQATNIPGVLTSDELLEMPVLPKSLYIFGGGTIAVEFASIFAAFGTHVDLFIRGDRILRNWDREIAMGISLNMKSRGIQIHTKSSFDNLQIPEDTVLLSAIGRKPNLGGLDSGYFDIGLGGGIRTDQFGRTRTASIFAAGDVVEGSVRLAHVGMEQGKRVARIVAGIPEIEDTAVVHCIEAGQEAASVGMTEAEAKEKGIRTAVAKQNMYSNARTLIATSERGFVKLIADMDTRKVIGAQFMCQRAGDLISEMALAVNLGLTPTELLKNVRPHPSYCESITEAAMILMEKLG